MAYDAVQRAAERLRALASGAQPRVGVVLGSGLGVYAEQLGGRAIPYSQITEFPRASVAGHAGKLVLSGPLAVLSGRAHFYEGHDLASVVLPVRTLVALGCKTIVLTNAAGGIRADFRPGALVVLRDHINLIGANPLRGPEDARLGPRFPDMSEVYDRALRALAVETLRGAGEAPLEGVYACLAGPSYETPAEIEMLRRLGADLVGMSTVPEAIAAHAMGARVVALSCVTNAAAGHGTPLSHDEVTATAERARPLFAKVLDGLVAQLLQ